MVSVSADAAIGAGAPPAADLVAARVRAATALRRLGHALVAHDAEPALLERIAAQATATADIVEAGAARNRPIEAMKRRLWEDPPADGQAMSHYDECLVSGSANPLGVAMTVRREGGEVAATVRLGAAFEGAPGRAHGGVVAAVFDDAMGYVLQLGSTRAYTGRLVVHYRAPVPLGIDLDVRAVKVNQTGRKIAVTGRLSHGDQLLAEGEALFITVDPARFVVGAA